jgi:hypothetical protein
MNPERGVAKKTTILSNPPKNKMRRGFGLQLDFSIRGRNIYALQITFRLSPVQIVNFLCPIDEISVIRASIEHKKLTI